MNDLTMPTIISVKQFDTTVSIKLDKSDTNVREVMDMFINILVAHGYQKESIDRTIFDMADKVREDVRRSSKGWKWFDHNNT